MNDRYMRKVFDEGGNELGYGFLLNKHFIEHMRECQSCQRFFPDKPETAVHLCLDGSILWKKDNTKRRKKGIDMADGKTEFRTTRDMLSEITRYKGEE